jgi:protein SCO1/2
MRPVGPLARRSLLALLASAWLPTVRAAALAGPVEPPCSAPALALTDAQGRPTSLPRLLAGHCSAVQLMFTGCSNVCPPQGLLFSSLAARARPVPAGFVSISIDALGDDPARLRRWQERFGAHEAWQAAVPLPADVDRLATFLRGTPVKPGTHNTQVFVFDAAGRLVQRTGDNPSAADIETALARAAHG